MKTTEKPQIANSGETGNLPGFEPVSMLWEGDSAPYPSEASAPGTFSAGCETNSPRRAPWPCTAGACWCTASACRRCLRTAPLRPRSAATRVDRWEGVAESRRFPERAEAPICCPSEKCCGAPV